MVISNKVNHIKMAHVDDIWLSTEADHIDGPKQNLQLWMEREDASK